MSLKNIYPVFRTVFLSFLSHNNVKRSTRFLQKMVLDRTLEVGSAQHNPRSSFYLKKIELSMTNINRVTEDLKYPPQSGNL